jgi:hypothetical protein
MDLHTDLEDAWVISAHIRKLTRRRKRKERNGLNRKFFPLTRHGSHRKRRVQQFFYLCVCNRSRGNVFTDPLPSNIHIQTHRLMGGIYDVRRWDGLRCHDTKFHTDWLRLSKIDTRDMQTHRQERDHISLLKEISIKIRRKVGGIKPTAISINMTLLLSYSSTLIQLHSVVDSQLTGCGLSGGLG